MSGEKNQEGSEAATGSRSRNIKLIASALVLLLLGAGTGMGGAMLLGGSTEAEAGSGGHGEAPQAEEGGHGEEKASGGHGEEPAGHGEPASGHGGSTGGPVVHEGRTVVNLGLFTVNLRGSGGGRVLRTEIQVEVDAGAHQMVETRKPVLRDAIITLASDFSYTDLEGLDGKTHLRDELHGRLNSVLAGDPKVDHIYFTEFVVQ